METGSAITWKYPSCVLRGDGSSGEFYSVALTKMCQQADTGTKMIHIGKNTTSTIVSKGIAAGRGNQSYRGLVKIGKNADGARNFTRCDTLGNNSAGGVFTGMDAELAAASISPLADDVRANMGARRF